MERLKLPLIKGSLPAAKWLPMEDYIKFVTLHLRYTSDRRTIRKYKKLMAVREPFLIR